jgi:hypothetical protein
LSSEKRKKTTPAFNKVFNEAGNLDESKLTRTSNFTTDLNPIQANFFKSKEDTFRLRTSTNHSRAQSLGGLDCNWPEINP